MSRKKIFTIALLSVLVPVSVFAADFLPKDKEGAGNVTVSGDREYHNLYVAGGTVSVNKEILGDLFAGGGGVNISGRIEKDLFAAGGNVNISEPIGEDARVAGGNVSVNAPIGGDLLAAGGTVVVAGGEIGGDFWGAGGVINLNSKVSGNVKLAGGEILINSEVGKVVEIWAEEKLTFGPQAKVLGTITYHGKKEAVVEKGAQVGNIDFIKIEKKDIPFVKTFGVFYIWKLLALLIAALIALKLLPKISASVITYPSERPWFSLTIGFVGFIVIPVLAVLLIATVIGAYAGIILAIWFMFALGMGGVFTLMFIGIMVQRWLKKDKQMYLSWQSVVWGVAAGGLVFLVPILGCLLIAVAFFMAFGGVLQTVKHTLLEKN